MNDRRVVITGLGAISPLGLTVEKLWNGLLSGACGIDTIKAFDPVGFTCKLAGEVPEFKIRDFVPKFHRKATKLMCRDIELSIVAAHEAISDSKLVTKGTDANCQPTIDPARMSINIGAGVICCDLVELAPSVAKSISGGTFDIQKWGKDGLEALTPLWLLKYLPNMLACHIGIIHDLRGPSNSITGGEAAAHMAIAEASQIIERNDADMALAGGAEAKVNPIMMLRQCLLKRSTSQNNDDPETACRPFDADAKGSVFGEGAGLMVLEELETAKKRNAHIYAEIAGTGESNSLGSEYHHLEPDGKGVAIAIEKAMAEANISTNDIDLILPHGTGIPQDDKAEATAIKNALGSAAATIPVLPTKSMLSTAGAASGGLDLIVAVKAMNEGKIPAAKNCETKAPDCQLNISKETVEKQIRYALSISYTFGGQTTCVIIKNVKGEI